MKGRKCKYSALLLDSERRQPNNFKENMGGNSVLKNSLVWFYDILTIEGYLMPNPS